uniref:Uncharacterized protein n=1 Tax=Micrurus carvalhoi TaxID=3147026 RepID=A0A2H6NLA0_9SAUR
MKCLWLSQLVPDLNNHGLINQRDSLGQIHLSEQENKRLFGAKQAKPSLVLFLFGYEQFRGIASRFSLYSVDTKQFGLALEWIFLGEPSNPQNELSSSVLILKLWVAG